MEKGYLICGLFAWLACPLEEAIPLTVGKDAAGNKCEITVVVCAEKRRKQKKSGTNRGKELWSRSKYQNSLDGSGGPISTTTQPQHQPLRVA